VAEVFPVARQHPVIAVKGGNPHKIAAVDDLLTAGVTVALPNPELAAVGKAVKRVLTAGDQWAKLIQQTKQGGAKVSLVGTVTEAAQAVKIGAADAALVWDATARQFGLEFVEVPASAASGRRGDAGVIAATAHPTQALHFARFLTAATGGSCPGQALLPADSRCRPLGRPPRDHAHVGRHAQAGGRRSDQAVRRSGGVTINTIYAGCGIHVAQMKAMKSGATVSRTSPTPISPAMFRSWTWCNSGSRIRSDFAQRHGSGRGQGNPKKVRSIEDLTRLDLRVAWLIRSIRPWQLTDDLLKKLGLHDKVTRPIASCPSFTPTPHTCW